MSKSGHAAQHNHDKNHKTTDKKPKSDNPAVLFDISHSPILLPKSGRIMVE
jgi:hypothetical protein